MDANEFHKHTSELANGVAVIGAPIHLTAAPEAREK
jgi:hypothetical protein